VHSAEQLSDKSILLVSIGSLLTPAGRNIDREGIKPDYVVEVPANSLSTGKAKNTATLQDAQYVKAIAILTEQLTQTNK
jgi:carboxyl-terminal processing protease